MSTEDSRKCVEDTMISEVVTISPMATLREAMMKMRQHQVKSLVVEKRHEADAYGILTYTTILKTIVQQDGDVDLINVYDIATKPAMSVPRQLEVRHAVNLMVNFNIKRLVVSSNNQLEGILTMNDIVGAILEKLED